MFKPCLSLRGVHIARKWTADRIMRQATEAIERDSFSTLQPPAVRPCRWQLHLRQTLCSSFWALQWRSSWFLFYAFSSPPIRRRGGVGRTCWRVHMCARNNCKNSRDRNKTQTCRMFSSSDSTSAGCAEWWHMVQTPLLNLV